MRTPRSAKLNEYNHAEEPARLLLERLGWTNVPRDALAAERCDEREALLEAAIQGLRFGLQALACKQSVPQHAGAHCLLGGVRHSLGFA